MPRYPNADVLKVAVMANGVFMGTFLGRAPLFAWEVFLAPRMCIGPPLLSMTRSMDNEAASSSHTWKKRGSGPRGWPASCPRPHAGGLLPFSLAPQPPPFRVHGDRRAEAPSPGQGQCCCPWSCPHCSAALRGPLPLGTPTPARLSVHWDRCLHCWGLRPSVKGP